MKFVFILNLICEPNSIKRINEFQTRGYDVEAFGFDRHLGIDNKPDKIDIQIIGNYYDSLPYYKRLPIICRGIKKVLVKTKEDKCIYYLRGLDVALCFRLLSCKNYIYEEADMAHVNLNSTILKSSFELLDKLVIRRSLLSVFLSEGFVRYHFTKDRPANVHVIPNKLNPIIVNYPYQKAKSINNQRLKIGFVGLIRYKSIFNFAWAFCYHYPQFEFHFFGAFSEIEDESQFFPLRDFSNCFFHGKYSNPGDLPLIYSQIDLVLSTYDVDKGNVLYAEPNKIYEAIYFETPIIVSSATYLADKVKQLDIGYAINAMDANEVVKFIKQLTVENIQEKIGNIRKIDKRDVLSVNDDFFGKLELLLKAKKGD